MRVATRDDVDRPTERIGAVHRRARPRDDLDAFDSGERRRDVAVVVAALAVVETAAVEQDEALAERGASDGKIGLDIERPSRANVHARGETKRISQAPDAERRELC